MLGSVLIAFGGFYYMTNFRLDQHEAFIDQLRVTEQGYESRIRTQENDAARSDERMTQIFNLLARIEGGVDRLDGRLDRLEQD